MSLVNNKTRLNLRIRHTLLIKNKKRRRDGWLSCSILEEAKKISDLVSCELIDPRCASVDKKQNHVRKRIIKTQVIKDANLSVEVNLIECLS